jgi:DNA-binding NarL/FixJ family response regulator
MTNTLSVALVEDTVDVREFLCDLINAEPDMTCSVIYRNAEEALLGLPNDKVDIVIVDIGLPGQKSGIDLVRELKPLFDTRFLKDPGRPQVQFMMYTVFEHPDKIFESLRVGASGYILKSDKSMQIIDALRDLSQGRSPISSSIARILISDIQRPLEPAMEIAQLTKQEYKVLELLAKGLLYKEIADELGIREGTVKVHVHHMYEKLHVQNRTEAVLVYLKKQELRGG